jgi:hypothetical protein
MKPAQAKQFVTPYLEKSYSTQKRAGRVTQWLSSNLSTSKKTKTLQMYIIYSKYINYTGKVQSKKLKGS